MRHSQNYETQIQKLPKNGWKGTVTTFEESKLLVSNLQSPHYARPPVRPQRFVRRLSCTSY